MSARAWAAVLLVVAVAALLRLPVLDADPPADVQFHFITDEGQYAHNARQKALFGAWVLDGHNAALCTAPLHTLLVERAFAWLGAGFTATRLPGAVAGVATCALITLLLAGRVARGAALAAGLMAATGTFMVTLARVGFTESLQLAGATLAALGVWRSRDRPAWAIAGALGLLVALGAKLSSAPVIVVVAVQWLWRAREARRTATGADAAHGALLFGTTLAVGAALALAFAWPHLALVRGELGDMARLAAAGPSPLSWRLLWLGFRDDPGGARVLGGLFTQEPALVIGAAWLAAAGMLGRRVPGDRLLVVTCWIWIAVLAAAIVTHPALSPDRRYLLLVPPLAILLALAAFEGGAPGAREVPRFAAARRLAAWGVMTLAAGLYLRPALMSLGEHLLGRIPVGAEAGLSNRSALALGWVTAAALAALVVALPACRAALRPSRRAARVLCVWAVTAGLAHAMPALLRPTFTLRDTSRAIGTTVRAQPATARIALGSTAETFALESDLRCVVVRDWQDARIRTNLDALERLDPPWVIVTRQGPRLVGWSEAFAPGNLREVGAWPVWPGRDGRPRFVVGLLARPSGSAPPDARSPAGAAPRP